MLFPGSCSDTKKKSNRRGFSYIHKCFPWHFFNVVEVLEGHFNRSCALKKINCPNVINSVGKNTIRAKCELL